MSDSQFSFEEIERMRAILAQHDQHARGVPREFDLNNPPTVPYVHQEFPKVMFHHEKRGMKKAHSIADMEEAINNGWSCDPYLAEGVEAPPELDPVTAAEVAALDAKAHAPKKNSKEK